MTGIPNIPDFVEEIDGVEYSFEYMTTFFSKTSEGRTISNVWQATGVSVPVHIEGVLVPLNSAKSTIVDRLAAFVRATPAHKEAVLEDEVANAFAELCAAKFAKFIGIGNRDQATERVQRAADALEHAKVAMAAFREEARQAGRGAASG